MISFPALRPGHTDPRPRSGPLETSSHRRHHGAGPQAVPTPERTMSPVRHKNIALVGKAAIRERRDVRLISVASGVYWRFPERAIRAVIGRLMHAFTLARQVEVGNHGIALYREPAGSAHRRGWRLFSR